MAALLSQLVLSLQREWVKARCRSPLVATSHAREELLQAREDPRLPPTLQILFLPLSYVSEVWTLLHTLGPCAWLGRRGDRCEDPQDGTHKVRGAVRHQRGPRAWRAQGRACVLGFAAAPVQPPVNPAALHPPMESGHPHPTPPFPANPWDRQGNLSPPVGHRGLPKTV